MKAKILLTSMVLPALFAACTNDEIVENNGGNIGARKTFEPVGITLAEGADTRFSWNAEGGEWNAFTAEDKFSAGLVDATQWTVGNKVMTNFVYSSADGKNFTTPSKMMEGVYFFYSYPNFEKLSLRSEIPFDLSATQTKVDLADPKANVNATQLFVSPLYRIEAANADGKLPLEFRSYWSTVSLNIKNTSAKAFNIVRIVLKNNAGNFLVKGTLDLTKLGSTDAKGTNKKLMYSYDKNSGTYVLPDKVKKEDLYLADFATAATDGNQSVIMVEVANGEVASGKEATVYLQVPAGLYTDLSADINVEIEEEDGKVVRTLTKELAQGYTDSKNNKYTRFRRGFATRGFGADGYAVDDVDLLVAPISTAQYAATYADFAKIVTAEASGTVEVFNVGSLKVDDQLLTLMSRLKERTVKFQNPIVVTTEASVAKSLKNIKFADDVAIEKGTFSLDADVAAKTLTVAAGAKAIVNVAQSGDIENKGTVDMAVTVTAPATRAAATNKVQIVKHAVDNNATLIISKTNTVMTSNDSKTSAVVVSGMPNNLNVSGTEKDMTTVTVNGTFTFYGNLTVNQYATVKTGTAKTDAIAFGKYSEIENYGVIAAASAGTITVNGELHSNKTTKLMATVNNYGELKGAAIGKYGKVVMKSESASVSDLDAIKEDKDVVTSAGEVDNTIGGFVTSVENLTVYAEYSGNKTGNPVLAQGINKLILKNGTWKNAKLPEDKSVKTLVLDGVTIGGDNVATLAGVTEATIQNSSIDKNLTMDDVTKLDLTGTTINAVSSFAKSGTALEVEPLHNVTVNAKLTLNTAMTLSIGKADYTEDNKVLTTTTVNAVVESASVTSITVNKYATLKVTVNGTIGNATASITNNGTVQNYGKILAKLQTDNGEWSGSDPVVK